MTMELDRMNERPPVRPKEPEPKPTEKQQPSAFDRVLEQGRLMQQQPALQQQTARQGNDEARQETRREGRAERRRPLRERGEREAAGSKGERVAREKADEGPQHRIVVKTSLKREQEGGNHQGGFAGHGGRGGRDGRESQGKEGVARSARNELRGVAAPHAVARFGEHLGATPGPKPLTRPQVQQLVTQLVEYLRVGRSDVLGDELQLGLNPSVFKGLRLRLTAKNGRVTVQFASGHAEVRALFERERLGIRRALESKGVRVTEIQVVSG